MAPGKHETQGKEGLDMDSMRALGFDIFEGKGEQGEEVKLDAAQIGELTGASATKVTSEAEQKEAIVRNKEKDKGLLGRAKAMKDIAKQKLQGSK